jgi:hypothetical protein
MIETSIPIPRSGSVARPIMKDSHSFDLGSNPNRSIDLLVVVKYELGSFYIYGEFLVKPDKSRYVYLCLPSKDDKLRWENLADEAGLPL